MPFGASTLRHWTITTSQPFSLSVGTFGKMALRFSLATASGTIFFASTCWLTSERFPMRSSAFFPRKARVAGPPPSWGMYSTSMFAAFSHERTTKLSIPPIAEPATRTCFGCALACAATWSIVCHGESGWPKSHSSSAWIRATGSKASHLSCGWFVMVGVMMEEPAWANRMVWPSAGRPAAYAAAAVPPAPGRFSTASACGSVVRAASAARGEDVGAAAGREADHERDGARREHPRLRRGRPRDGRSAASAEHDSASAWSRAHRVLMCFSSLFVVASRGRRGRASRPARGEGCPAPAGTPARPP